MTKAGRPRIYCSIGHYETGIAVEGIYAETRTLLGRNADVAVREALCKAHDPGLCVITRKHATYQAVRRCCEGLLERGRVLLAAAVMIHVQEAVDIVIVFA